MTDPSDESGLVRAMQRGDADAIERLWIAYAPRLVAYARTVLAQSSDQSFAEDVVQQVFVSLVRLPARNSRAIRSAEAWLITATRRAALNAARGERRERRRRHALDITRPGPSSSHEQLRELIERLPSEQAEVISLRHAFGMTFADIARLIGSSKSTVAQRHAEALKRLRRWLADADQRPTNLTSPLEHHRV
ncbi:MAG: RNA polymerase sigma factor [Planctomycetota bacterium]